METSDLVSVIEAEGLVFDKLSSLEAALYSRGWDIQIPQWQWQEMYDGPQVEEYPPEPYEEQDIFDDVRLQVSQPPPLHYAPGPVVFIDDEFGPTTKEHKHVTIRDVTYINGMDIECMSVEQFLDAIKTIDDEIKRLTDLNVKSSTVTKSIEGMKDDRARIVILLDKQHSDD